MNKKKIAKLENRINGLESNVTRLESSEREDRDLRSRVKQLECYEEYGHNWLYQVNGGTERYYQPSLFGHPRWIDSPIQNKVGFYYFKCRDCSKVDKFDWSELDANMRSQIRAIDPDLVPKK